MAFYIAVRRWRVYFSVMDVWSISDSFTVCHPEQKSFLWNTGCFNILCQYPVCRGSILDLVDLYSFVQQIAKTQSMQKDCPGDIDPEQKEKYGTDTSVHRGIGLVVHNIENEAAF